ncbi:MAG: HAD family hydrolase [Chloroflexi bacterium]|nr:HAD family hydrolase [Chloroflexota bacterium]
MSRLAYPLVVFDFDGTIADTTVVIAEVCNEILIGAGHESVAPEVVFDLVGLTLETMFAHLLREPDPSPRAQELARVYRERYYQIAPQKAVLFPNVFETLQALRAAGATLTIASGKSTAGVELMLEALQIDDLFDYVVGATSVTHGKPHPEMLWRTLERCGVSPREAIVVGDTRFDLQMGRAAGLDTCAVTYGAQPVAELAKEQPTFLVHSAPEIVPVVFR